MSLIKGKKMKVVKAFGPLETHYVLYNSLRKNSKTLVT